jgi:hypothetical protein
MGRALISPFAKVDLGHPMGVKRIPFIGVDNNYKETRISVDHLSLVASLQVPEDRGIIKKGKVHHVLYLLKFGRVDFANLRTFKRELLMAHRNNTFASRIFKISRLQDTLAIAFSFGVRDPHRPLGIINFGLVSSLHIHIWQKELSWIRILLSSLGQLDVSRHGGENL